MLEYATQEEELARARIGKGRSLAALSHAEQKRKIRIRVTGMKARNLYPEVPAGTGYVLKFETDPPGSSVVGAETFGAKCRTHRADPDAEGYVEWVDETARFVCALRANLRVRVMSVPPHGGKDNKKGKQKAGAGGGNPSAGALVGEVVIPLRDTEEETDSTKTEENDTNLKRHGEATNSREFDHRRSKDARGVRGDARAGDTEAGRTRSVSWHTICSRETKNAGQIHLCIETAEVKDAPRRPVVYRTDATCQTDKIDPLQETKEKKLPKRKGWGQGPSWWDGVHNGDADASKLASALRLSMKGPYGWSASMGRDGLRTPRGLRVRTGEGDREGVLGYRERGGVVELRDDEDEGKKDTVYVLSPNKNAKYYQFLDSDDDDTDNVAGNPEAAGAKKTEDQNGGKRAMDGGKRGIDGGKEEIRRDQHWRDVDRCCDIFSCNVVPFLGNFVLCFWVMVCLLYGFAFFARVESFCFVCLTI
jgi:hypothetical protein